MRCPHCGAKDIPHIAVADIGLTEAKDNDVLTCTHCDGTSGYIEWLKDEIAQGAATVLMEADASTADTQEHVVIELAIHRGEDGAFDHLETLRSVLKTAA